LIENPIRSGFFIGRVNVGFIYVGASSCWLEGKAKASAGKAQATRRLIGRSRKAKPCTEINKV